MEIWRVIQGETIGTLDVIHALDKGLILERDLAQRNMRKCKRMTLNTNMNFMKVVYKFYFYVLLFYSELVILLTHPIFCRLKTEPCKGL